MKFHIFLGHHKVGTTALQDFLWRNAAALLGAGILYPPVESEGQALFLRQSSQGRSGHAPFNARESHNALAFRLLSEATGSPVPPWHPDLPSGHQMLVSIRNQIRYLQPRALLLVSEVFSNFGHMAPQLIERLASLAPDAEVTLHLTLRRPDAYIAAWHAQRLRFGHRLPRLDGPEGLAPFLGTIHMDWRGLLQPWLQAFPRARLSLRNYDAVLTAGGSIPDFLAQAGLDLPADLQPAEISNGSLHPGLCEFIRHGNATLPREAAHTLCEFLIAESPGLTRPHRQQVEPLGAENRALLAREMAPSIAWLDRLSGQALFPDLDRIATCLPLPLHDAGEALRPQALARMRKQGLARPLIDHVATVRLQ